MLYVDVGGEVISESVSADYLEVAGTRRMPVERTEHRGAAELHKYYEVYETIGSGAVLKCFMFVSIRPECGGSEPCLFLQAALLKLNWADTC